MVNLTKSFYIKILKKLVNKIKSSKNNTAEWDICMRDINFVSSMYRFPRPSVAQMDTILNICDKLGIEITDKNKQRIRNIYDYERILKEENKNVAV